VEDILHEQEIVRNSVRNCRDEISKIIDLYIENIDEVDSRDRIVDDIIEHFVKIIFKLNRFNEFKSKFKILERGKGISKKELERCSFVIKFGNNRINIVKNTINDIKGSFQLK